MPTATDTDCQTSSPLQLASCKQHHAQP
jgi:hypothetical protein